MSGSAQPSPCSRSSRALCADDVALVRASIARIASIGAAAEQACLELISVRYIARGQYLLRAGESATEAGVVARGLLRELYVLEDGSERTKAFVLAGEPTGSLADLLRGGPSRTNIVAEEDSRVLVLPFAANATLAQRFPSWQLYQSGLLQVLFLVKVDREYELLGLDAEGRYAAFRARYPGLETRVAARHVASYLGISSVHLSRLRRRLRLQAR
jgi:CRP-like cAMP-binding protein